MQGNALSLQSFQAAMPKISSCTQLQQTVITITATSTNEDRAKESKLGLMRFFQQWDGCIKHAIVWYWSGVIAPASILQLSARCICSCQAALTEEHCIQGFFELFQRRPSEADFAGLWHPAGAIVFTLVPQAGEEQFTA